MFNLYLTFSFTKKHFEEFTFLLKSKKCIFNVCHEHLHIDKLIMK